ncbi:MAG: metallopeptidase family protein [Novosphingobium sp.]
MARVALAALPQRFTAHLGDVVLLVENLADDETLADLGIDDPFELTGLYEGTPMHEKSLSDSSPLPDRIVLYRRAILDEWAGGDEDLEHLVAHVLIHEVGHHFGLSDEDIEALEHEP